MKFFATKPPIMAPSIPRLVRFLLLAVILVAVGGILTVIAVRTNPALLSRFVDTRPEAQKEMERLVKEIGTLIDLPTDENPTVATVSDASKLSSQSFFAKGQNGDKVLFYTKAKKIILYRPETKKIIEVAPLTVDATKAAATPKSTPSPAPGVRVALRNGTTTAGLTTLAAKKIATVSGVVVTDRSNAAASTYTKNILVSPNRANSNVATQLAALLDASIEPLPAGESLVDADILVILAR